MTETKTFKDFAIAANKISKKSIANRQIQIFLAMQETLCYPNLLVRNVFRITTAFWLNYLQVVLNIF